MIDGVLVDDLDGEAREITDLTTIATLPGRHNWQNAGAAYAAARAAGLAGDEIIAGMASYPGLAHRMERIAVIDGILYVNDSKATNGGRRGPRAVLLRQHLLDRRRPRQGRRTDRRRALFRPRPAGLPDR